MREPESVRPGDKLYVGSSYYIDHGEDDREGGIATVDYVKHEEVPKNPVNSWFVYFVGLTSGINLTILLEEQEKLERQYAGKLAHQCSDLPGYRCPICKAQRDGELKIAQALIENWGKLE